MDKITKHDLKSHDWFVSKTLILGEKLQAHRNTLLAAILVFLLGGTGWAVMGYLKDQKEQKAQTVLNDAELKYREAKAKFDRALNPPPADPKAKIAPKDLGPKPTGDLVTDYKDVVDGFKNVIAAYPSTQAAVLSSLHLGKLYFDYKKYDDMVPLLETAEKNAHHPVVRALVANQLATGYDAKNDCQKAVGIWEKISVDPALGFIKGSSLVNAGLCYEKLGQKEKAEEAYKKAENANDPEASQMAKKLLRFLKWNKKA